MQPAYGSVLSGGLLRGSAGILAGYLLYEAWLRLAPCIDQKRWRWPATVAEVALIGILLFCLWIDDPFWNVLPTPLSALLILQMAAIPGHLARLFQTTYFAELGNISYSIYLLHIPLFAVFVAAGWLPQRESGLTPMWFVYLLALLALSVLCFHYFERPAQRRVMRLA